MDRPKRLVLSVAEAAEMLGISKTLAYNLVARKELPSRRFGGRIVVLLRALERLLEDGPDDRSVDGASASTCLRPGP